jgi:general secretion pathway protein I
MTTRPKHQGGFTLLEVIVAIVIAALCLSALAQVFATGMRSAALSSDYTRAMTMAQGLLATAGIEKSVNDGSESGASPDGRLAWTLTVAPEPTDDAENPVRPPFELKRLNARVVIVDPEQSGTGKTRSVELTTLLAVPRATP